MMLSEERKRMLITGLVAAVIGCAAAGIVSTVFIPPGEAEVGFVDSARLMQLYPGAKSARTEVQQRLREWQSNIDTLESELAQLGGELGDSESGDSSDDARRNRAAFLRKREELARYRHAVSENARQLEEELMQPVLDELDAYLSDFGEQTGYYMILGTGGGGTILFARETADLTQVFLGYVEQRQSAPTVAKR